MEHIAKWFLVQYMNQSDNLQNIKFNLKNSIFLEHNTLMSIALFDVIRRYIFF